MTDLPLQNLLRDTSRSFYLTMRVWPRAIRAQVGLAYLLARTTDTIADTDLVPVDLRLQALRELRDAIVGQASTAATLVRLAPSQNSVPERQLLERTGEAIAILQSLSPGDVRLIRDVLTTIISGQEMDLQRFGSASSPHLTALETDAQLDDYTYRVAGCVGEFLTRIFRAHLFPRASLNEDALLRDGIRFGQGLQLVNILRDIPADLNHGRCYIPRQSLSVAAGLTPEDLRSPATEPKFRPLYNTLLDRATAHLEAGWNYTNTLPSGQWRVRLGCAWCILIGVRTLRLLRDRNVLDSSCALKIPRSEVYAIMARSIFFSLSASAWKSQFTRELTRR